MTLDVHRLIGAVNREVSTGTRDGAPVRGIVATRTYDTTQDDLWDAVTNPERLPRWFLPVSGEFRLGGRYSIEGNASGEITECEPPRRLALTWEMHGKTSWVTVDLTQDAAGGTHLRVEHTAPTPDAMWDEFGPGAGGVGWDLMLLGLDQHFVTGDAVTPENAAAWMASDEGRSFVEQSSDGWCDAAVEAGTDPKVARTAADRTTAFYTGDTGEAGDTIDAGEAG